MCFAMCEVTPALDIVALGPEYVIFRPEQHDVCLTRFLLSTRRTTSTILLNARLQTKSSIWWIATLMSMYVLLLRVNMNRELCSLLILDMSSPILSALSRM